MNAETLHPLATAVSRILNRILRLDPAAAARLRPLAERSIRLDLQGTPVRLQIRVLGDERLEVQLDPGSETGDLTLRASPGAVLRLLASGAAGVGQLRIEGDAELARQLQQLAQQWQPDLDALFTAPFGDVLGFQLARAARGAAGWLRRGLERSAVQAAEYLREERRDVVAAAELERFLDEVDDLRDDVERAAQRVDALIARRLSALAS